MSNVRRWRWIAAASATAVVVGMLVLGGLPAGAEAWADRRGRRAAGRVGPDPARGPDPATGPESAAIRSAADLASYLRSDIESPHVSRHLAAGAEDARRRTARAHPVRCTEAGRKAGLGG